LDSKAPESRRLGREDIGLLHELTVARGAAPSEYCAANIYLFRETHQYRLRLDQRPLLLGRTYDGQAHVAPLFAVEGQDWRWLLANLAPGACLFPLSETDTEALRLGAVDGFEVSSNLDDADYLFRAADLATLAGPDRKARRNQRAQFIREAGPRVEPFDAAAIDPSRRILEGWLEDVAKPWAMTDFKACLEALELWRELKLFGLIVYTRAGEPAGFLLASGGATGAAIVHFAKGRRGHIGVYAYMFSRFAEIHGERHSLINFEQDLGKPGFRRAKRAYGPALLSPKFRVQSLAARPPGAG